MLRDSKVIAWTDRHTDRYTDTQTDRHTHTHTHTDTQTDTQTDRHDRKHYLPAYAGGNEMNEMKQGVAIGSQRGLKY